MESSVTTSLASVAATPITPGYAAGKRAPSAVSEAVARLPARPATTATTTPAPVARVQLRSAAKVVRAGERSLTKRVTPSSHFSRAMYEPVSQSRQGLGAAAGPGRLVSRELGEQVVQLAWLPSQHP